MQILQLLHSSESGLGDQGADKKKKKKQLRNTRGSISYQQFGPKLSPRPEVMSPVLIFILHCLDLELKTFVTNDKHLH